LGRVTVFIGENGCGKSNILEAIALGSAAAADKLDNEFLASRGIRVTDPKLMRSAFDVNNLHKEISFSFTYNKDNIFYYTIEHNNNIYSNWTKQEKIPSFLQRNLNFKILIGETYVPMPPKKLLEESLAKAFGMKQDIEFWQIYETYQKIQNFFVFFPQIKELKIFEEEGQVLPLGINGEGLFKYLHYLSQSQFKEKLDQIKEKLELIDWFDDLEIPGNLYPGERTLKLKDRYLDPDLEYFDQKSANEGFLFLLFYFCLFIGEETPKFFAIDNIDSSLNPLLCRRLIEELVELAKKHNKQVILTTHNPAALDGLDLHDEEQKLYVISRKLSGHTRADQVFPPKAPEGKKPVRLSEAFLRGYIGGLPENF
jgi:AAA15 family ATPase/GTPase